ncbi:GLUG motif-containing protein [uncultured Cloacibacillus sp.]|uniref:GLUG motif-containing protein n=1 Tax=uncultured Cloacibacillus sp. TaxID=889794 RepID=UPI0026DD02CB|nr:GLUG motif-containing protein [uncultured Cloacibacillus sp.]
MTAIKRLVTSALTALILAASVYPCFAAYPTVSSPTPHYRRVGSGEDAYYEIDYYTVSSAAQLRGLASLLSPEGPVYITADIWLNPDDNPTETEFVPIGGENRAFVGTIDGMGHTIHNLYINQPDRDSTGLIGRMTGSISNITVTGSVTGHTDAAGIVGYLDRGAISNVTSKVTVNGYLEVGGVVGYAGGSVTSSENYGTVTATYGAGGVAGSSSAAIKDCANYGDISVTETAAGGVTSASSGTLTNCRNYGSVDSTQQSGGVVGALNGTVTNCVNYGTISGDFFIGGLSSRIYTGGKITQCYNYGHIEAKNMAGGVTGYNDEGTIDDCHNRKEIIANIMVAGIAGYNKGTITNCTSTGKITAHATEYTGGIAGENDGQIDDSYFSEGSADAVTGSEDTSSGTDTDSGVKDDAWFDKHYPSGQEPGGQDNPNPGGDTTQETIIISQDMTIEENETYIAEENTNVVISGGVTVTDKGTLENNDTVTIKNQGTLVIEVTGEITGGGVIIVEDGGKVINNSGKPVTVTDEEGNTTEIQPGESHTEDNPDIKPDKILETDTTIPEGETYPIAPDESLVIPDDVTLTVEGTLDNDGMTTVQDGGTIHVTDTGTITGGGTIVVQPGGTIINDGKTEFIVVTGNGGTETVNPGQSYTDQPQIYVIAQSDTGGSISPAGKITVNYGGSLTFSIKPQSSYEIENVAVNGIAVGAVSSYTMSDIKESSTIQAFFKHKDAGSTIVSSGGGSGCNATHASAALAPCAAALAAAAALRRKKDK